MFTACCARTLSVGGVAGRALGDGPGDVLERISHICKAVPMSAMTDKSEALPLD